MKPNATRYGLIINVNKYKKRKIEQIIIALAHFLTQPNLNKFNPTPLFQQIFQFNPAESNNPTEQINPTQHNQTQPNPQCGFVCEYLVCTFVCVCICMCT